MTAATHASVYIFDSNVAIRHGLRQILQSSQQLKVVGDTSDPETLMHHVKRERAAVYVIGLSHADNRGLGLITEIRSSSPDTRVVAYADSESIQTISRTYERGVRAFISNSSSEQEIVDMLCSVVEGEIVFGPGIAQQLAIYHTSGARDLDPRRALTEKELKLFVLLAEGRPIPNIARQLELSEKTVRNRAVTITHKLDIERSQFADVALAHHLIKSEPVGAKSS